MDQQQFGTWAAIAIHDTSSVVGAGAAYGEEALKVATTIKPVSYTHLDVYKRQGKDLS